MTKATHDPITGERVVAPETQAAGHGYQNAPGLTSGAAGGQSRKAAGEIITAGHAIALKTETAEQDCLRPVPDLTSGATGRDTPKAELGDRARLETATFDVAPETAAAAVALASPSLLDLGRQLATLLVSYDAHDIVALKRATRGVAGEGLCSVSNRAVAAQAILGDRIEAVRALITTIPAQTIADVAVQIEQVAVMSSRLSADGENTHEVRGVADQIERMAYSMLPIVAAAAELSVEAMNWEGSLALRVHRFAAVGVTS